MYLDNIDNDIIDLAILTRESKGQIVDLRALCEHIIVKKKVNNIVKRIWNRILFWVFKTLILSSIMKIGSGFNDNKIFFILYYLFFYRLVLRSNL